MSGKLSVVGIGPGAQGWVTPEATAAIAEAEDIYGYGNYLERVSLSPRQRTHKSDNREELDRARAALARAAEGARVVVVSSGDPGVFAMAAAIFEAIEAGPQDWRRLDVEILPGLSAMQAAAARLGAPLGHDFCAISLSDNLKPWTIIAQRLEAAVEGDFVIALYNPASRARPDRIHDAFALLKARKAPETPVAFARAVGRVDEAITLTTLGQADPGLADMATLVIVGSSKTRLVERGDARPWMLTPRAYGGGA